MLRKLLIVLLTSLGLVVGLSACSSEPVADSASYTIIDVRTPAEYAAGHLEGAINIDVESGQFAEQVATLDKAEDYAVYCRSGRRSAIAADQMSHLGFTQVTDLGSVEAAASATGLPVQ